MEALRAFRIPVAALRSESATYSWELGQSFFQHFGLVDDLPKGEFQVDLEITPMVGGGILVFFVNGQVHSLCDRCNAPIDIPIDADYQLIVKFGDPDASTDEVMMVDPDAPEFSVAQLVFDFALLSVPIGKTIPGCEEMDPSPCDQSIVSFLKNNDKSEEKDESPWDDLKRIFDN